MKTVSTLNTQALLGRTSYAELVAFFPPRPIHDKQGYENTMEVIEAMAGFDLNDDQNDYMEMLSEVVENYETEQLPPPRTPSNVLLAYLLKENDMGASDLAGLLDVSPSIAYRILKGTRRLTTAHIAKLSERFCMAATPFLQPPKELGN